MSAAKSQSQSSKTTAIFSPATSSSVARTSTKLLQVKVRGTQLHGSSHVAPSPASTSSLCTPNLTDQDIDDIVLFLLEKLNDYSDELNRMSTSKEMIEKELKSLNRQLHKHASKIKLSYGNRILAEVEIYFEKMLRLCMRELELQHCFEQQSDMEDELQIVGDTIEQFDLGLKDLEDEIWWRSENLTLHSNNQGQLAQNLQALSMTSNQLENSPKTLHVEIVEKMRSKMRNTCEQLSSLYDKIINMKSRQAQDRASFDRFCQLKQSDLRLVMPHCQDYFDKRLNSMMLKPKLEKLTTKIDRIRRTYTVTMKDLYLVSCYIHQMGTKAKSEVLDNPASDEHAHEVVDSARH